MPGTAPWSFRSRPEQNARPEPVSTITRHALSARSASNASASSMTSSIDMAFSRSGRLRVTTARRGSGLSTSTTDIVGTLPGPLQNENTF